MATAASSTIEINDALIEAIRAFPIARSVQHCGQHWTASPFDFYADCPQCGAKIKLRSFSGCAEIEDVFDAVFEWMNQPGAEDLVRGRRESLADDDE